MRNYLQFLWPQILGFLLLLAGLCLVQTKSTIEACNSSDSCPSLLSYLLPWDSKFSEIATRFHVNVPDILASNSVFPITPSSAQQILSAKSLVKIPISCSCVDGIRRSISTTYTVHAADTLASISDGYGGLVSAEQIKSVNSINATNPLTSGGTLVIPLPCTCFNNVNNGGTAIYMSYVVQRGESLESIATMFGTTFYDLETVNGLGEDAVDPGDILSVPIAACSSATLNWYNESMMVPNGSYTLTASNCIKCTCESMDIKMRCVPSGLDIPCYNLRCKGSNLVIGDEYVEHSKTGCNVSQCVYRGHRGGKILSSMNNSSYLQCPDNRSHSGASCSPSTSPYPADPFVMSPKPSPFLPLPVSKAALRTRASSGRLGQVLINVLQLFLLEFILYFLV
ncbi:LysM domain-containing GPI-anchored protein 1 [Spatholobus suberectus]|nr:LysM domain-containing GPI-anchored protein 1 [Spatholobus suberectus]